MTIAPPLRNWRANLRYDLPASIVVFLVALPLSLGIAAASQAPLAAGVIAAIAGGVVAGVFGGSPLAVSGPAAGMVVVVADLVDRFGWAATCAITVGAGLLQVALGSSRIARSVLAISPTVLHAMLAGIGVTILLGQVHVLLGGRAGSSAWENVTALPGDVAHARLGSAALGIAAVALLLLWPKLPSKVRVVPGPLVAVVTVTLVAEVAVPDAARVEFGGSILDSVALPRLPDATWSAVLVAIFTVAVIASVESLLCALATDAMARGRTRTRLDKELVGQGLGNTVSGLLGGLPITAVIVRSTTNVSAGARTRASTVLHGIWMAVAALVIVDLIERIPLAALAALLVVIGAQLVKRDQIRSARSHGQLLVYLVTLAGVVFLNLLEGVVIGLLLSAVLVIRRAIWADVRAEEIPGGRWQVRMRGTLSFLAVPRIAAVVGHVPPGADIELDLHADYVDHTAFSHIAQWRERHEDTGGTIVTTQVGAAGVDAMDRSGRGGDALPRRWFAPWRHWHNGAEPLRAGVADYHRNFADRLRPAMAELADGQQPDALFITCADSRIVPHLITSSGPGDLFTVRNLGNIVPIEGGDPSVTAAVEYAVNVLHVNRIVVCGHSGCGAMTALFNGGSDGPVGEWLAAGAETLAAYRADHPAAVRAQADGCSDVDRLARTNVAVQLDRLERLPTVAAAQAEGKLELVGMFFDIPTATCLTLDRSSAGFAAVPGVPTPVG